MTAGTIYYEIFFNRRGYTLDTFLQEIYTLQDAVKKFEEYKLFGYNLEDINDFLVLKNSQNKDRKKSTNKKPAAKPTKPRSSRSSKPRKARTRKKAPAKKASKEKSGGKNEDDSSYFETWKVPYVEP